MTKHLFTLILTACSGTIGIIMLSCEAILHKRINKEIQGILINFGLVLAIIGISWIWATYGHNHFPPSYYHLN